MRLFIAKYLQQFGRFQRDARLYLISNALSGVTVGIILVLYNLYLSSLGFKTDFIGLVLFIFAIGAGIAIFPAGLCVDRFGGKAILIWASVEIGFAGAGQILLRQPGPLLISSFLAGVGGAFILVVNAPYLTAHSTSEERPHLFSLVIVVSLITTVVGELLGGALPVWFRHTGFLMSPLAPWLEWFLADQPLARSYQLTLLLAGIIAVPSFIPLFLMSNDRPVREPQSVTPEGHVGWRQRLRALLLRLRSAHSETAHVQQNKCLRDQDISPERQDTPRRLRNLVLQLKQLAGVPLVVLTLVWALRGLGAGLFISYFNLYFVQHLGASSALFGFIDGAANTLNALATLAAPWLAMRIGKVKTITLPWLAGIPVMLTVGLTSFLPLAATLYPLRQMLTDMSTGIFQAFSMEEVAREHRGIANSSYQAAYQVASALTVPLGGLIISRAGFSPVFIGGACLYLVAIAVMWYRFGRQ